MDLYCARGGAENRIKFELFADRASSAVTTSSIFLDGLADLVKRPAAARASPHDIDARQMGRLARCAPFRVVSASWARPTARRRPRSLLTGPAIGSADGAEDIGGLGSVAAGRRWCRNQFC